MCVGSSLVGAIKHEGMKKAKSAYFSTFLVAELWPFCDMFLLFLVAELWPCFSKCIKSD